MNYNYMLTEKYVHNWTILEAIRELIANALDACEGTDFTPEIQWNDGKGRITNEGVKLLRKHMLLGESDKSDNQIGQWGEGLKLAALVMVREHRMITVHSGNDFYMFMLDHSTEFDANILAVDIDTTEQYMDGTVIEFECSESEIADARDLFLKFKSVPVISEATAGSILDAAGEIYVMGVKVMTLEDALFGYDIRTKQCVNRDRSLISRDRINQEVRDLIGMQRTKDVITKIIKALRESPDDPFESTLMPYFSYNTVWIECLEQIYHIDSSKLCLASHIADNHDTRARYLGYKVVDLGSRFNRALECYCHLPYSHTVKPESIDRVVPEKELTTTEKRVLNRAKKMVKKINSGLLRTISKTEEGVKFIDTPVLVTEDLARNIAQCGREHGVQTIWINRNLLRPERLGMLVQALIHEGCHLHTGAKDCTQEFQQELDYLMTFAIINLGLTAKQRVYQEYWLRGYDEAIQK